ncbi:MAG: hypothetical protein LJF04_18440 [Gemmatimonadetes bacterium]|nr:hypothetical protein [Gemmatimonadota bacterium]
MSRTPVKLPLRPTFLAILLLAGVVPGVHAQAGPEAVRFDMVDPAMDDVPGPFSYYSHPTDVIGVMDGRGTEVTPEGYLYTGYGELMFLAGPTLTPVSQRIRTLRGGWLPVVEYDVRRGDVAYHFTLFAATLDGNPESPVVNFVRVTMTNTGATATRARIAFAVRYTGPDGTGRGIGDNRFRRPATARRLGQYDQPGVAFDTTWTYGFADGAFLRGGKAVYLYPTEPAPELRRTPEALGTRSTAIDPVRLRVQQTTPTGAAVYDPVLAPGASEGLVVKLPYTPTDPGDPWLQQVRTADFDTYLASTEAFWRDIVGRGMQVDLPESKVVNAFRANLVYDLLARDKRGDDYVQTVNEFHYHAFWLRDASYIARAYDVTGYPDIAAQVLAFFAGWQQEDGNFVSQGGQYDGWGQTLWAYGQHYRLTRDRAFAERVLPAVKRAVDWLHAARASDIMHLVPATTPGDNEEITGHVTGHDFWALAGLHGAIDIANGLGDRAAVGAFRREYDDLEKTLMEQLKRSTATTGGYIQPGLDGPGGQDWGNMMSVYPEQVLDPHDPMVTATLDSTRAKYAEGIMTYGDGAWLHDYLTMKNTETEVIRGDQETALRELYAVLLHTSSTHAGFEYSVRPWGTRDFGGNLAPHGWFAAKYRTLLRDMLVREEGEDLHLFSVVSPAWIAPGKSIIVTGAPTDFGPVDFRLTTLSDTTATLDMAPDFTRAPAHVVVHVPWFMSVRSARADGRPVSVRGGALSLPPGARNVTLTWTRRADKPAISYDTTVGEYKAEYRRRWEEWTRGG